MKKVLVGMMVMAFVLAVAVTGFTKPEFAKATGKKCTDCHVKAGQKDLNDAGKEYQKTLKK